MPFDTIRMGSSAAGAYEIERSVRLNNNTDDSRFEWTPSGAGNTKVFTFSCWVKRSMLGVNNQYLIRVDSSFTDRVNFDASDRLVLMCRDNNLLYTTRKFRDTSAWYHIVVNTNTDNGTAGDRHQIWINGVRETAFDANNNLNGLTIAMNAANDHHIGGDGSDGFGGYMAEVHLIDGQQIDASNFGETDATTGEWISKKYAGTYGTNGFYLDFKDNSGTTSTTLGKDSSGNGNNFTPQNFSVAAGVSDDSLLDTPTNNCCTMSSTDHGGYTITNSVDIGGSTGDKHARAVWALPASGKYYWEVTATTVTAASYQGVGIAHITYNLTTTGFATDGSKMYAAGGGKYHDPDAAYGATWDDGDVISIAVDMDAGKIWGAKNGTWQDSGNPATGANPMFDNFLAYSANKQWHPSFHSFQNGAVASFNFGQRAFAYDPPTGYGPLSVATIPEPTIKNGADCYGTLLYTGNETAQTVNGLNFNPDLIINTLRNGAGHTLVLDSVRGIAGDKMLTANDARVEGGEDGVGYGYIIPATGGFQHQAGNTGSPWGLMNYNGGYNFVNWCWKGGSTVTNDTGSVDSQVNANATAGFSIVTYTGTGSDITVGHGLGVAPDLIMVKCRNNAAEWGTYLSSLAPNYILQLSVNNEQWQNSGVFNNESATSSVFSADGGSGMSGTAHNFVAYCFASVEGYSKIGTYTGNGSADGTFIYTGFRPAFVLCKKYDGADSWEVHDSTRVTSNPVDKSSVIDVNATEGTSRDIDFLANGFKQRNTNGNTNQSGSNYIFMAFAETPFKYANAR